MKQYMTGSEMRMVGKGWEIRNQLRTLVRSKENGATLQQLLAPYKG
ncbi:Z-ring formation inhibitor MciZ [Paenibacillus sp. NPDC058071]